MIETVVHLQPGYLLQHRPYRETSLIFDALTRDYGRVSIIAKGVRKTRSASAGLLRPFLPLQLSFAGRSELKTLTHVESSEILPPLQGMPLYCGFYVNELIGHFLHKFDPHPEVFLLYRECLRNLAGNAELERILRVFELNLLISVGYGLQLDFDERHHKPVVNDKKYFFYADAGPIEAENGDITGRTLLALHAKTLSDSEILLEAKKIMRTVIDFHLQGKPLKSRVVIARILKQ